jgi:hypothetical protein
VPRGESGEVAFKGFSQGTIVSNVSNALFHKENEALIESFTQQECITTLELDGGKVRVLIMDRTAASLLGSVPWR